MDVDGFFWSLNSDIEALFRLRIQSEFSANLVLLVLLDLIHISLPVIVIFQGAVQFVGGILNGEWDVLVIDIHAVFEHLSDLLYEVFLGQW